MGNKCLPRAAPIENVLVCRCWFEAQGYSRERLARGRENELPSPCRSPSLHPCMYVRWSRFSNRANFPESLAVPFTFCSECSHTWGVDSCVTAFGSSTHKICVFLCGAVSGSGNVLFAISSSPPYSWTCVFYVDNIYTLRGLQCEKQKIKHFRFSIWHWSLVGLFVGCTQGKYIPNTLQDRDEPWFPLS